MNKELLPWISRKKIQDVLGLDYYKQAAAAEVLGFSFKKNKTTDDYPLGIGGINLRRFLSHFHYDWIESGDDIIFFQTSKKIRRDSL